MKIKPLPTTVLMISVAIMAYAEPPGERLNEQGVELGRDGKLRETIAVSDRAIAIEPHYDQLFYNRGKAKLTLKDFKGALADFDAALKLTPDYADAFNNRGITKKKLGDIAGAIADYTSALKFNPQLHRAYYNRGVAHYDAGDTAAAIADFTIAAENNIPGAADAFQKLRVARQ
jgi:tetratricopeptide (TPR) repeat protein